jgi:predicted amidohydrolase
MPGRVLTRLADWPEGILYKYRKVNTWIPYEVHTSPHDLEGYDEPLFPVAETPIGRLGCAICYDWLFPEAMRQLAANGAEVLIRVSAYMDPWGATEPMAWWTVINRARAIENIAYVAAANQGASLQHYRPIHGRVAVRWSITTASVSGSVAGPGRANCRRAYRHFRTAPRTRVAPWSSHAGASADRGLSVFTRSISIRRRAVTVIFRTKRTIV